MNEGIKSLFPPEMQGMFLRVFQEIKGINEIRLRVGGPAYIRVGDKEIFICSDGNYTEDMAKAHYMTKGEMFRMLEHLTKYSPYAYDAELRRGFLTMPGGHRVGVVGQGITAVDGQLKGLKYIYGMNIRIAGQAKGMAKELLPYLYTGGRMENVLIVSPPGCGKTTMLRDLIRLIGCGNAYGKGQNVGLVDERMEVSAMHMGEAYMDLGGRCDVLSGVSKAAGIEMLIRSMNPSVVAVDEIAGKEDAAALRQASGCGVGILATIHGNGVEDLFSKEELGELIARGIFTRIVFLRREPGKYGPKSIWAKKDMGGIACIKEWD